MLAYFGCRSMIVRVFSPHHYYIYNTYSNYASHKGKCYLCSGGSFHHGFDPKFNSMQKSHMWCVVCDPKKGSSTITGACVNTDSKSTNWTVYHLLREPVFNPPYIPGLLGTVNMFIHIYCISKLFFSFIVLIIKCLS